MGTFIFMMSLQGTSPRSRSPRVSLWSLLKGMFQAR
jgi:hypothetical protein